MENLSNEQLQQYVTPATRIASARDLVSNPGYVSIVSMASGSTLQQHSKQSDWSARIKVNFTLTSLHVNVAITDWSD